MEIIIFKCFLTVGIILIFICLFISSKLEFYTELKIKIQKINLTEKVDETLIDQFLLKNSKIKIIYVNDSYLKNIKEEILTMISSLPIKEYTYCYDTLNQSNQSKLIKFINDYFLSNTILRLETSLSKEFIGCHFPTRDNTLPTPPIETGT